MNCLARLTTASCKTTYFVTHSLEDAVFLGDIVYVLSARPGRVFERIDVDIPRETRAWPRDAVKNAGAYQNDAVQKLAFGAETNTPNLLVIAWVLVNRDPVAGACHLWGLPRNHPANPMAVLTDLIARRGLSFEHSMITMRDILLGFGQTTNLVLAVLVATFLIVIKAVLGLKSLDPELVKAGHQLGHNRGDIW